MIIDRKIPPEIHKVSNLQMVLPEKITLPNGTPCFFISGASEPLVYATLVANAGTKYQQPQIPRMVNSLLVEGAQGYEGEKFSDTIDKYGGFLMNNLNNDIAALSLVTQTQFLDETLPLLFQGMYYPEMDEKNIKSKAKKFYNTRREALLMNGPLADTVFLPMVYGANHPYAKTTKPDDYTAIKSEEIRAYHKEHYHLSTGYLLVVGGFNENHTKKILSQAKQYAKESSVLKEEFSTHEINTNPGLERLKNPSSHQAHIKMGFATIFKGHPDYIPLKITVTLLGGYLGSRLMQNIREKMGLTYDIHASLTSDQHAGLFKISSDVKSDKADLVVDEVKKQISVLHKKLVEPGELQRLKNYLQGEILSSFDGMFARQASFMATYNYGLKLDYFKAISEELDRITPEKIREIARKYLRIDKLATVIVEPKNN